LTTSPAQDDYASYSADGRQIYFNSDRAGGFDIWRIPAGGAGPDDSLAERITADGFEDWSPHPSPDGRNLIFLSYPKGTRGQPEDRDVTIRRLAPDTPQGRPEEVVRFVGGTSSLGSEPWSPDGKRFAFVAFEPPPPTIRIVFYTPSDVAVPDGLAPRMGRVVDSAERCLVAGMKRAGYPPAVERLFRRGADGSPEILYVRGDRPTAAGVVADPSTASEIIGRATRENGVAGEGHLWWIFVHRGPPPTRFDGWAGRGDSRDGGWAIVHYNSTPGDVRPDLGPEQGFNAKFELKGTVHELGHAFGLPHIGPDPALGLGNSLMGANNSVYAERRLPKADRVYLTDASAAILWKHPVFSGRPADRARLPLVKLADFRRAHDPATDRLTITGRVVADSPAHSAVVLDDLGRPADGYWYRQATARIAADGNFRIIIDQPARAEGTHRLFFCFDNGMVIGDGDRPNPDDRGEILKPYRFRAGRFEFAD